MSKELEDLLFKAGEGVLAMAIGNTTKQGVEVISSMAVEKLAGDICLKPKYDKAVKRTIKIAATVAGSKLAYMYAEDITAIVKGAYYGYKSGIEMYKMAKGCDNSGSESEVLDGGSEEE